MKMKLIELPEKIDLKAYEHLTIKIVGMLMAHQSVLSVYQMGSIKDPGISDLDLICVFNNGSNCSVDVRGELTLKEKQILTHSVFAVQEEDVVTAMNYNLLSNLKWLAGKDLLLNEMTLQSNTALNEQIALEYLLKMFISLDVQITLKIIKVRSFLLLAKAIKFDLELLNVHEGGLYNAVEQVFKYRASWFLKTPSSSEFCGFVVSFYKVLSSFLKRQLKEKNLFLPYAKIKIPGGFYIYKSDEFKVKHIGVVLPNSLSLLTNKLLNIQFRMNKFYYNVNYLFPIANSVLEDRFVFSEKLYRINKQQFPSFIPLTTSLGIYN